MDTPIMMYADVLGSGPVVGAGVGVVGPAKIQMARQRQWCAFHDVVGTTPSAVRARKFHSGPT